MPYSYDIDGCERGCGSATGGRTGVLVWTTVRCVRLVASSVQGEVRGHLSLSLDMRGSASTATASQRESGWCAKAKNAATYGDRDQSRSGEGNPWCRR